MKIRFVGRPDTVRAWAARMSRAGVVPKGEQSRHGGQNIVWYGEIDDRVAVSIGEPPALGAHRACPVLFGKCQDCGLDLAEALKRDEPCAGRYVPEAGT